MDDAVNVAQLDAVETIANSGWDLSAEGEATTNVAPGEEVNLSNTDGNIDIANADNDVTFDLAADLAVDSVTTGDSVLDTDGLTITGGPSITASGGIDANDQVISSVGVGEVSGTSTDAINGSQLFGSVDSINTVIGGNATVDGDGAITTSDIGNTGQDTVHDAIDSVNTAANAGWNVTDGTNEANIGPDGDVTFSGDANIDVAQSGVDDDGQIDITLNPDLNVDSVTTGDSVLDTDGLAIDDGAGNITNLTNDGLTIAGGLSITATGGIDANDQVISSVGAGEVSDTSTDAINGSQLFGSVDSINTLIGGNATVDGDGVITTSDVGGTGEDTIDEAISSVNTAANAGWNVTDGTNEANIGPDGDVTFSGDANIDVAQSGVDDDGQIDITLAPDLNVDSVTTGDSVLDTDGLAIDDGAGNVTNVTNDGLTIADGPSITASGGIDANEQVISNIDAPVNDGDAVNLEYFEANKAHYYSVNDDGVIGGNYDNDGATGVNAIASGVDALASADGATSLGFGAQAPIEGSVALGSGSAANRALAPDSGAIPAGSATITYNTTDKELLGAVSVGDEDSYRQITNVADGIQDQDAVTVRQLQGAIGSVVDTGTMYFHANSDQPDSLAVGEDSIAVGPDTVVDGDAGIGMGNGALVDQVAPGGTAIGDGAHVMLADGMALGTESLSEAEQGIALGAGATVSHDQSVALGSNSVTAEPVTTPSTTIAGTDYDFAGVAPDSTVSVGDVGEERTITNVAAGRLSSDSTDAVNGSQLFATNQAVETASQGWDLSAQGADTTNVAPGDSVDLANTDGNLVIEKNDTDGAQEDVTFDLSDDVTLGNSLTVNDGPTIDADGIDMGGDTITDVGAPMDGGDATNKTYVDNLGGDLIAQGMDFAGNEGGAVHRDLGQVLSITGEATASGTFSGENLKTVTDPDTGAIQLRMADAPQFGDVVINEDDSGRISGVADGQDGDDAVNVSQLEDVSDVASTGWDLSAQDGSATNVAPGGEVNLRNADGNLEVTQATANGREEVTFDLSDDVTLGNSLTVNDGPAIDGDGIDMGGDTITNVGDPVDGGDAVNLDYFDENRSHYYSVNDDGIQGGNYDNDGATGVNAIASGVDATATADGAVAMGDGATASEADSVALGSDSVTAPVAATTEVVIDGETYVVAGSDPAGSVSVGDVDAERTVTNVAAGRVNETSTDAVNGSQLYAATQSIETLSDEVEAGQVSYYSVNDDGTQGGNYANDGATGVNAIAAGVDATATADGAIAMGDGATASVTDSVALGSGATTEAAVGTADITLGGQTYAFAGASPVGTFSVGSAGAERTITNVAAGRISADSTDAINGSQLHATNQAVESVEGRVGDVEGDVNELDGRVTNVEGDVANVGDQVDQLDDQAVKYDTNNDGSVDYDSITLEGDDGTTISNVADGEVSETSSDAVNGSQLWEVQEQVTNINEEGSKYFTTNSEKAAAEAQGDDSVAMGPESVAQGDQSVATGDGAVAESEGGVALGAGSQATREGMDGAEEAFSGESVASTQGAVSVGSDGGERQVTHVAGGTETTDAVNVRQLESVQAGAVNYDRNDDGSVDYSSVTMGQEGTPTQVHNVAAGEAPTDAANVGQLQDLNRQFSQQIDGLGNRIDEVERDANAGIAGVAAMGDAPYVAGKLTYHVGGGYHSGESAVGVNFRRTADNGRWSLTAGAAGSRAGATISLGVSGVID